METRNAPTAQDAVVTQAIGALHASASAALAAQSKDPDANTDPADKKVLGLLTQIADLTTQAAAAQAADGAPDKPSQAAPAATPASPEGDDPQAGKENYDPDAARSSERETVVRQVEFRSVPGGDGRTLEGYAAVFDDPTIIEGRQGAYSETIQRGAFAKTISERKPVLMFDHGQHPMVGNMPIGTITQLREDPKGLYVQARMSDNWLVQPVTDAIEAGSIDGMSIRMVVMKDKVTAGTTRSAMATRSISEVALLELGPVVFPAYENTEVSLRSRAVLTSLADPEVRSEIARIAAATTDEPTGNGHSRITRLQRRARVLLSESK